MNRIFDREAAFVPPRDERDVLAVAARDIDVGPTAGETCDRPCRTCS
jgi:hypothetical protein